MCLTEILELDKAIDEMIDLRTKVDASKKPNGSGASSEKGAL